mmetsp:Transcript_9814/g.26681  ORF Transcript_9814/g.26681 Transcript_9814/m.26681 type:complete len:1042 (-) Transcript_9814:320-3445(-)|eukprot:CAMPEP_0185160312 /NCGR_PEP_ID=MMETSP1139-20130426/3555_1 /TAXON_ID=298111 /ORGANISM="Pavlova sp., Strain CCMP459" /LENGTH=1041 /DNA_ID=CAMNT_0027725517 /DNA_START=81 /DNA_END=3206 /DNA_ORIENTATION=+
MTANPHAQTVAECLAAYGVTVERGLTDAQVAEQRRVHGPNELDKEDPTPLWKLVLAQFDDLLVKILLAAAMVSFVLAFFEEEEGITAFVEPFVILLILVINAVVGVWQESNAESALEALKELQSATATVVRNGELLPSLSASDLVPGDVVHVRVGDKVPADCRVLKLKTTTIRCDEGSLTGESATVQKIVDPVAADARIQGKVNMLFSSTTVSNGTCVALVVATGMRTEIGKIQSDVQTAAEDEEKTPLGQKLDDFGEMLTKVITVICLLVWVMNFRQFFDPVHGGFVKGCIYYMKIAVALGVAAIPEGLPAVITLCLSLGTRKMVQKNAIVRKLPSVETLGCTTVICSDKTGTLTTNQMTAVSLVHVGASAAEALVEYEVEGTSYRPEGRVVGLPGGKAAASQRSLLALSKVFSLCNEARVTYNAEADKYERVGEPTEAALRVVVEKVGLPTVAGPASKADASSVCNNEWTRTHELQALLEFSRDRKSMGVLVTPSAGADQLPCKAGKTAHGTQLLVKGAPESVLARCTHQRLADGTDVELTPASREQIISKMNEMARRPLRVLAAAIKEDTGALADYSAAKGTSHPMHAKLADPSNFAAIESDMTFLGLVGIKDPARPEVGEAIEKCGLAGIRVIMITGDTKDTAEAIAKEIGIFGADEDVTGKSFTGADFFSKSAEDRRRLLMEGGGSRVFSRTEPRDKQELVRMLRQEGEVPAMTGDGVNDAPALKQAAIGIAMGITGTEVAKEAADMVLADDNFATIVAAVEEGRSIYSNMKAFIRYLISSNIGEVASIFITALLGIPEGMIPVQLLWVNLVTDGPPATALGFNPADKDIMRKPPRSRDDQLITPWVFFRYMVVGAYVGFATVGIFVYWYLYYDWAEDGHSLITFDQLSHWGQCPTWTDFQPASFGGIDLSTKPCLYFTDGKVKASTLSLSVLVTIEMLNALNALSEDGSLLQMPPWCNPWLLLAMFISFGLHFVILYVPFLASIFSIVPLTYNDWILVLAFSVPVIFIDEVLKFVGRIRADAELKERMTKLKKSQ